MNDGTDSATYSYLANSPLISQLTYRSKGATRMTTTKSYDYLNRLSSIASVPSVSSAVSFAYNYNDANQRTRVTQEDGSYWIYECDSLGQLTSGKRFWADGTPVAGQQFEYAFDEIGNRKSTKAGGDATGAGLRYAGYSVNSLNQYASRAVPGAVDVVGIANPNATVTVNTSNVYRRGEYYWKELGINNASAAVWQSITNQAVLAGATNTGIGSVFLPKNAEYFTFDADGNLTSDGRWTNRWDAENRLVEMETLSGVPDGAKKKLRFTYDERSRRVGKTVSNWTGSAWALSSSNLIVYDGWNLVAEVNATNKAPVRSFMWGIDLSGTTQGAGGVGGLLAFTSHEAPASTYFVGYDGNGNVAALVDGKTGAASARYEQGPFAEAIRESGAAAGVNPVKFSSKYQDKETDQFYYGYRFYNPTQGRWLSRDPIGERGGGNAAAASRLSSLVADQNSHSPMRREELALYVFVENSPSASIDIDGRQTASGSGTGALPNVPYPAQPIGCSLTCCDDDTIEAGRRILRGRYLQAVQAATAIPLKPVNPPNNGPTRKNSSRDFINWLLNYPPCWYCYLEERDYTPNDPADQGSDHQVIICNAYGSLGQIKSQIMFDWWGQTTWNKPYGEESPTAVTGSTYHSPNQMISPKSFIACQGRPHGPQDLPKDFNTSTSTSF